MDAVYDLVVVRPVKNKPGQRVCGLSVHAKDITSAIKKGREWFEGSGYAVLQASQFNRPKEQEEPADEPSAELESMA